MVTTNNGHFNTKLIRRACSAGDSKLLATNTTLKLLAFTSGSRIDDNVRALDLNDDDIKRFSARLRTNKGLELIQMDGRMILSTTAEHNLKNALLDNTTLTQGLTVSFPNDERHNEIQRIIQKQPGMNRFWEKLIKHYNVIGNKNIQIGNNNTNTTNNGNDNGDKTGKNKSVDHRLYPAVLGILSDKPQFLFQFLRSESPHIFRSNSEDPESGIASDTTNNTTANQTIL